MRAAMASPIMTDVKWVLARQSSGMMDASATRRRCTPLTEPSVIHYPRRLCSSAHPTRSRGMLSVACLEQDEAVPFVLAHGEDFIEAETRRPEGHGTRNAD